jgi:CheY-like chemotaxis protein
LIRVKEGQFNFSLTEESPKEIGSRDISMETLDVGINPQELVLDLARGIDEDRRRSSAAIEASFAAATEEPLEEDFPPEERVIPPPPPTDVAALVDEAPPPAPPQDVRTVLLVDDEDDVRGIVAENLSAADYLVIEAPDPDTAIKEAQKLKSDKRPFLLLTDLAMPTSGGSSFQGGFEVVKRLSKMHLRPPTLIMTESPNAAAQARARQMGIPRMVFKPGLSKLDPPQFRADLMAFSARLVEDILPRLTRFAPPKAGARRPSPRLPAPSTNEDFTRQFSLLQKHLAELRHPSNANQISLLIMRTAREFFERSILLLVKNETIRGLAGFGQAPRDQRLNLMVREISIPLREPSIFSEVASNGTPYSGTLPEGRWEQAFIGRIGRFKSNNISLHPLLAHMETIAILFGDNPETGRDLGNLSTLEVFMSQAGISFENIFLQRKIEMMQQQRL